MVAAGGGGGLEGRTGAAEALVERSLPIYFAGSKRPSRAFSLPTASDYSFSSLPNPRMCVFSSRWCDILRETPEFDYMKAGVL